MPASPSLRISPGRELRTDNHTRGHSLERRIAIDEKEDDLALFNEAQNKERENFLLQSSDDFFSDIFSTKLKHLSDSKSGFSVSARGESSDLLNALDKNDYDWLMTPPESPLFPSLDDEAPTLHARRGRPRSQPIAVSRMVEKGHRSTRGSQSPRRLSPSPRSGNTMLQARSRTVSHSSPPPPTFAHTSPSRRLSPPPSKLTLAAVSGTPTVRSMSTGSASVNQSRIRGTSPVKTSIGHSASLKTVAWQLNMPGFSCEAPPNLRTSLADRPGSYVRGSSPASRNSSGSGRQSMSPTASRSVSSSHSHEKEPFGYYTKCSVASSGDDDFDSQPSATFSNQSVQKKFGSLSNSRSLGISKKPTKILSSSAPKRPSDFFLKQLDKKGPHMFRPLLSSVPSSTFSVGKASAQCSSLNSKGSSLTICSNATSDQSTGGAYETAEVEKMQNDLTSIVLKQSAMDEELLAVDTVRASNKDVPNFIPEQPGNDEPSSFFSQLAVAESSSQVDSTILMDPVEIPLDGKYIDENMDGTPGVELCCRCYRRLLSAELVMEGGQWVCLKCKDSESNHPLVLVEAATVDASPAGIIDVLQISASAQSLQVPSSGKLEKDHIEDMSDKVHSSCYPSKNDLATSLTEEPALKKYCNQFPGFCLNSKFDVDEVEGLSLLLKRPSSVQRHIGPSRSYTTSYTSCDDFSYMRDSLTSLQSSVGQSSMSISSSLDLVFSRPTDARVSPGSTENGFEVITKMKNSQVVAANRSMDTDSGIICKTTDSGGNLLLSTLPSDGPSPLEKGNNWTRNSVDSAHEETSISNLQSYGQEEDNQPSSSFDVLDAQVPQPSTLDTMLELGTKTVDVISLDTGSDTKSAQFGNISAVQDDHITRHINQPDGFEESTIAYENGGSSRAFTREEATDMILLCSSVVHDMAYNAADIPISKESGGVRPPPPFPSKPNSDRKEMRSRTLARRSSNSYRTRQRKLEIETKSPQSVLAENEGKYTPRIILSPAASMGSTTIPPKLESKCNCTIM